MDAQETNVPPKWHLILLVFTVRPVLAPICSESSVHICALHTFEMWDMKEKEWSPLPKTPDSDSPVSALHSSPLSSTG